MKAAQREGSEGSSSSGSIENGWPQDATAPRKKETPSLEKKKKSSIMTVLVGVETLFDELTQNDQLTFYG